MVRALWDGALVVLKDLQRLPPDLLQPLVPLLDPGASAVLHPPGCPHPIPVLEALIFATCTVPAEGVNPSLSPEALTHFAEVQVCVCLVSRPQGCPKGHDDSCFR